MKPYEIQICVCTACVLSGAPALLESALALGRIEQQLSTAQISSLIVKTHPALCQGHPGAHPFARVGGLPCPGATPAVLLEWVSCEQTRQAQN